MSDTVREIGSTIAKLRALLSDVKKDLIHIQNLQDVLTSILDVLWDDTKAVTSSESVWKETLSLVASGRVLSIAAQAEHALDVGVNTTRAKAWISNGSEYCRWLGRGVVKLALQAIDDEKPIVRLRQAAQVCGKSLTLGHNGTWRQQQSGYHS
jgi:telomere length regulation protein